MENSLKLKKKFKKRSSEGHGSHWKIPSNKVERKEHESRRKEQFTMEDSSLRISPPSFAHSQRKRLNTNIEWMCGYGFA